MTIDHDRSPSPRVPPTEPALADTATAPSPAAPCASSCARRSCIVVGALTSAMFLLIFRYVFGGAIDTGDVAYVDFLIPGLAAAGALFAGHRRRGRRGRGHRQRPVRPAPVAADPAVGRAGRPLDGRHRAGGVGR